MITDIRIHYFLRRDLNTDNMGEGVGWGVALSSIKKSRVATVPTKLLAEGSNVYREIWLVH